MNSLTRPCTDARPLEARSLNIYQTFRAVTRRSAQAAYNVEKPVAAIEVITCVKSVLGREHLVNLHSLVEADIVVQRDLKFWMLR